MKIVSHFLYKYMSNVVIPSIYLRGYRWTVKG